METRKAKIIGIVAVILVVIASFLLGKFSNKEEASFQDKNVIKQKNFLSYFLENDNGEYEATSSEKWPTTGYKFNATLSKCENGGELGWDDTNKVVTMTGNMSDKCYIYFDKYNPTLAKYVISQYTGTQGDNNIYYHNSSLTNGAGDNSYRYAGASASVDNYVCFGSDEATCPTDSLYRIIGVFGDQVKLIKATAATSTFLGTNGDYRSGDSYYYWSNLTSCPSETAYVQNKNITMLANKNIIAVPTEDDYGCNEWKSSSLNKTNLNTNFIEKIGTKWSGMIYDTTWKVGGNTYANIRDVVPATAYKNEVGSSSLSTTYGPSKIGLMYVSDYGFAALPSAWTTNLVNYNTVTSLNWLYLGSDEWTISPCSYGVWGYAFTISPTGVVSYIPTLSYTYGSDYYLVVRPTFYLTSNVTYSSGTGTASDPIRLGA